MNEFDVHNYNMNYRIADNFRGVPVFVIFVIDSVVMIVSPYEN